jgi:GNAT superfamily N-acetyltransferase
VTSTRLDVRDLTIEPLTPDRLDDLATLFDQPGDPKWCWCASFHIRGSAKARPRDENRMVLTEMTVRGRSPGLIAYRDGRAIGWVSVAPRNTYQKLAGRQAPGVAGSDGTWSIVCFVVDRQQRGRGLARTLLGAAIDRARSAGATAIEAYPVDPLGEQIPAPVAYAGTRRMFEEAGFRVVGERRAGATRWPRPVVRLDL